MTSRYNCVKSNQGSRHLTNRVKMNNKGHAHILYKLLILLTAVSITMLYFCCHMLQGK